MRCLTALLILGHVCFSTALPAGQNRLPDPQPIQLDVFIRGDRPSAVTVREYVAVLV